MSVSEELSLSGLQDQLILLVAGRTDPGCARTENQDNFLISDLSHDGGVLLRSGAAEPSDAVQLQPGEKGALLLVADGMGGAAAGRLASGLACTFVLTQLRDGWQQDRLNTPLQFATRLREAVERANHNIYEHACRNPSYKGMGTTVTAAGVFEDFLYIAQVGDSRAYLVRGAVATQITHDQSYVQRMVDAGAMTLEEAERSAHGSMLLQALGSQEHVEVELTYQPLRRGDVLIVCSDGLHRLVQPNEIASVAQQLRSPAHMCMELITIAIERGGPDNITVLATRFDGSALREPAADDVVARKLFVGTDGETL